MSDRLDYSIDSTNVVSIVEMNLGIIAASMPALPQLFAKSRAFRASTYKSLPRLLSRRDPPSVAWFGQSSKSPTLKVPDSQRRPAARGEDWTELQSLPDVRGYETSQDGFSFGQRLAHIATSEATREL